MICSNNLQQNKIKINKIKTLEAIENYDKPTKLDPENSIAHFRIVEGLQKLGKYEETPKYYDRSLSLLLDSSFVDKAFRPDIISTKDQYSC